jgi:hypothetical protein
MLSTDFVGFYPGGGLNALPYSIASARGVRNVNGTLILIRVTPLSAT